MTQLVMWMTIGMSCKPIRTARPWAGRRTRPGDCTLPNVILTASEPRWARMCAEATPGIPWTAAPKLPRAETVTGSCGVVGSMRIARERGCSLPA